MTQPESWTTKDPITVQAMLYVANGDSSAQAVKDWVMSLQPEGTVLYDNQMGTFSVYTDDTYENFIVSVSSNQYVYLDEDGFHSVSKAVFELGLRKVPPPEEPAE